MNLRLFAITLVAAFALIRIVVAHDGEHVQTPSETQHDLATWGGYVKSASERLEASSDPRDWVAAAIAFHTSVSDKSNVAEERAIRTSLLSSAMNAAPDDVVVQWAALVGSKFERTDPLYQKALTRLQDIDAGNAAVWMEVLVDAAARKDRNGVSAALHRMATSTAFTNHLAQLSELVVRAFRQTPISDGIADTAISECADCTAEAKEIIPLMAATAITSAMALPAFQVVMNACTIDASDKNADRADDCRTLGRLIATTGDSFIATRIGFGVLRVSHTFTDDDVAHAREADWVFEACQTNVRLEIGNGLDSKDAERTLAFQSDWLETGTELGAFKKALEREHSATIPAADWQDRSGPFTDERLKQDASRNIALDY